MRYLFRFEKHATAVGWPEAEWATFLPSLLKGKALSTYHELSLNDSLSYHELKKALLSMPSNARLKVSALSSET